MAPILDPFRTDGAPSLSTVISELYILKFRLGDSVANSAKRTVFANLVIVSKRTSSVYDKARQIVLPDPKAIHKFVKARICQGQEPFTNLSRPGFVWF